MYLITVKYDNDAERKRLEYVFEKWAVKLKISKPDGIVAIVNESGDEPLVQDFVRDLLSRSSNSSSDNISEHGNNITVYKINRTDLAIEREEKEFSLDLHEKRETIEKLLSFIMAKQKAILKRESDIPSVKTYEVTSKKGTAEIMVLLREKQDTINLVLRISGYGEVVDFICDKLKEEFKYFEV
jgi:hypothetical protein